jgi:hypothetical protein
VGAPFARGECCPSNSWEEIVGDGCDAASSGIQALAASRVVAVAEMRRNNDGGWDVIVTRRVASQEAAARMLARLEAAMDDAPSDRSRLPSVDVNQTDSAEVQLARAFAYVERVRRNGDGALLIPVLVAIRTGWLQWHLSHWKGGSALVSKFPGVLTPGEVSKAATTIRGELGELLDRRMPLEEALHKLMEWIDQNAWQAAYDRHSNKRR